MQEQVKRFPGSILFFFECSEETYTFGRAPSGRAIRSKSSRFPTAPGFPLLSLTHSQLILFVFLFLFLFLFLLLFQILISDGNGLFRVQKSRRHSPQAFAKHSSERHYSLFFPFLNFSSCQNPHFSIKGLYIIIALFSLTNSSVVSPVDLS